MFTIVKRVVCALFCIMVVIDLSAEDKASLIDIKYSALPGGKVQINLMADGFIQMPTSFKTSNPNRVVFDFYGVKKSTIENVIKINVGKVEGLAIAQTQGRVRIVLNLNDESKYELARNGDGLVITVFNESGGAQDKRIDRIDEVKFNITQVVEPSHKALRQLVNVDFRRSPAGGGNVIIQLSDPKTVVDIHERDGELIVDMSDTHLPSELEQRLDVVDFATPVQSIDMFRHGDNVRLVIVSRGKRRHSALQSGNQFILTVEAIEKESLIDRKADNNLSYSGERLSLRFQSIEVRSALTVIADFTGLNFVTSDSVKGQITLNLDDVPWDQALDMILRTKGLAKRRTGNVVWIAPLNEITDLEQKELKANSTIAEYAPLVSEIIPINYAKAKDIADVIKSVKVVRQGFVSPSSKALSGIRSSLNVTETDKNSLLTARGSVTVDARTNSLLVQDLASKIKELRKVISQLDKPVRQVMIETRIVEASDTFSRELGARLGFQRLSETARISDVGGSIKGHIKSSGSIEGLNTISDSLIGVEGRTVFDTTRSRPGEIAIDLGANGIDGNRAASYAFDIFKAGRGYANLITLELSALEADGRGKIVASPRLVTANQKEATIKQGEERVFTVVGADDVEVKTKEAVLALKVTPQITPDDRVVLDVKITQDSFIPVADGGSGVAAALRKKEIVTQVLADNGETIVIGGIYQEEESEGEIKVPLLGDIPILGNLFKKRSKSSSRVELLIFLTPKIISPELNLN